MSQILISPTISILLGSTLLSMYPFLIKMVSTNLFTQVFARVITTALACYVLMTRSLWSVIQEPSYYVVSLLYLFHIYSSYVGFTFLDVKFSSTIFYLYPLINVLIRNLFIMRKMDLPVLLYFFLRLGGVALISFGEHTKQSIRTMQYPI